MTRRSLRTKAEAASSTGRTRTPAKRSLRSNPESRNDVPAVFREMLDNEQTSSVTTPPPTKRRRVRTLRQDVQDGGHHMEGMPAEDHGSSGLVGRAQTAYRSDESDKESFDWEDVDIDIKLPESAVENAEASTKPLEVIIGNETTPTAKRKRQSRKPLTMAEKKIRLDVHKIHILCLLYHVFLRNHWCNDPELQRLLRAKKLIPAKFITNLNLDSSTQQFRRSERFKDALKQVSFIWAKSFSISAHGLRRSHWRTDQPQFLTSPENTECFLSLEEFRNGANKLDGSADFGAQLFCSLLRALGVETRLVCSIQPLGFMSVNLTGPKLDNVDVNTIKLDADDEILASVIVSTPITSSTRGIRRLGERHKENNEVETTPPSVTQTSRTIPKPRHPIFWVEAFDQAYQKWIPIDPLVTHTFGKPLNYEPPLNDPENFMTYVIAFEESGIAKDVTRRYAKAYTAKTRKFRLEWTDKGDRWLKRAMKPFRRTRLLDREQLEDAQLLQRELSEGLPKNIEDFKGHPVYVLERHLRRDEIIHPKHEVGKIRSSSRSADLKSESVYRRSDVHTVRSANKWFRLGRQIKPNETPLKRGIPSKRPEQDNDRDQDADDQTDATVGLYATFQTEIYRPCPVRNGKIPKNNFGNIDIYVPTMIPQNCVQIKSRYARQAARILGVDYADAVTGFKYKGRQGTAVLNGVVALAAHQDAMLMVLRGLAFEREQAIRRQRSSAALSMWKRLAIGLSIVDRVNAYKRDESDEEADDLVHQEIESRMESYEMISTEPVAFDTLQDDIVEVVEPPPLDLHQSQESSLKLTEVYDAVVEELFESEQDSAVAEADVHEPKPVEDGALSSSKNVPQQDRSKSSSRRESQDRDVDARHTSTEIDDQSLISHDPEDEDAEPDWLD